MVDGREIWLFTEVGLQFDLVFGSLTLCRQRADYACWKEKYIYLQKSSYICICNKLFQEKPPFYNIWSMGENLVIYRMMTTV